MSFTPSRRRALGLAGLATLAAMLPLGSVAQELTTVKFGSINATSDAGVFLADELGFFTEEGLKVEITTIDNAPALTAAIATNQLDVAGISVTPGLFTATEQGINLRIVGDKQSFSPGFGSTKIVVRSAAVGADEKATVEALRGKTVAVNSRSAITYYFITQLLAKYGMTEADVNLIELSYANIATSLRDGRIEVGTLIEPFVTQVVGTNEGQLLGGDLLEFVPGGQMSVTPLVYSEGFRAKQEAAEAFMRAYFKGVRAYNDAFVKGIDKDRVIAVIADRTRVSAELIGKSFLPGLDPNQRFNPEAFLAIQSFYASKGLIRNTADNLDNLVDTSFADAALAALGEYK